MIDRANIKISVLIDGNNCSTDCTYYIESFCKLYDKKLKGIKRCVECLCGTKNFKKQFSFMWRS